MRDEPLSPVARLAGVSHRYGAAAALDDVSTTLEAGRMIGLIGPDGVGKSTLLGLVAGVRALQTGAISVLGGDIADAAHRHRIRRRVAYMPQGLGRSLYPTLTVAENLDFFGRLFGQGPEERETRIAELLRATGLDPFPDRPAGKLSGGMKQKLALCAALIHDPDLLILDEPTTGVDPLSRRQFWRLIERLRERRPGMTVVTATAYMSEAEGFDQLIAMHAGSVLAEGAPAEIEARAGVQGLEAAFISLLPSSARRKRPEIHLPPRISEPGPPAIEAKGLSKRFGEFTAVDSVSFRIERGEIFGFLGSNGCGKTTTMKMLTGLLTPSAGEASLFGEPMRSGGLASRRRVGYMSQSFSLYAELTVRRNLELHAAIFQLTAQESASRVEELLAEFALAGVADAVPDALPLGVRQRLQLAVAVLHRPEMLILDEPTSGVDPVARDQFWALLIDLSRAQKVTIFISTHFMNEAERCDRISLMHAGRVLAVGAPEALRDAREAETLEDAFVSYLAEAAGSSDAEEPPLAMVPPQSAAREDGASSFGLRAAPLWAYAHREALELVRDPIRLAFALLGPLLLMAAMGFGISFDVERLAYATLDQDRSAESRQLLEQLSSSRYFTERPEAASLLELDRRMTAGEIGIFVVVPPDFGRDLLAQRQPEIGVWLDGSNTVRAEAGRGYVQRAFASFLAQMSVDGGGAPLVVEPRFRYNQAFLSVYAIPPGILMMMLMMIPTMLTALAVVRERELGSIVNFYGAPVRKLEFLIGKQLPYIALALVSFVTMAVQIRLMFGLDMAGQPLALILGAAIYVTAATAFGLLLSTFITSQIAAVFASSIIVMIPSVYFSGMMYPVAVLEGGSRVIGQSFPPLYFQEISAGVYNKGLGLADLYRNHLILIGFCMVFWSAAALCLRKQGR